MSDQTLVGAPGPESDENGLTDPLARTATPSLADARVEIGEPTQTVRYHDMDSLRAAMMLLGLFFHAAWFFMPVYFGNPLTDVHGSVGFLYFFCWVHQFRMQVFFLIAGFFACLLVRKRGAISFAKNRFFRVAVPLGISMLTIWPIMKLQYIRGGLTSGRILSEQPLMAQYWEVISNVDWPNERIRHLWFLHALILIYGIAWGLTLTFKHVIDRKEWLRPKITSGVNWLTRSHLGPFLLAIPIAACMAYKTTWFGINTGNLNPRWSGVIAYWVFFGVGWCLYSQPEIINVFTRRWTTYLLVGTAISILLGGYFGRMVMNGRIAWSYPALVDTEIDYISLRTNLLNASSEAETSTAHGVVWGLLDPTYRDFVVNQPHPSSDQVVGFAGALSRATVLNPNFTKELADAVGRDAVLSMLPSGSAAGQDLPNDPRSIRVLLPKALGGDVKPLWIAPMWIKGVYFYGYAFATWLLTFAMLGLFRKFFSHPSPTIRYLADSSYWLYLIHLPLQFELSIDLAHWQANGFVKFLIYNVITFAVLLPSYHFLVRSTWLGLLLNGRLYPLRKKRVGQQAS